MASFTEKGTIVITCYPYLSSYLALEVTAQGLEVQSTQATSVTTQGTLEDCIRLNYALRTASRVLYSLNSFPAQNIGSLYEGVFAFPWERFIDSDSYFSVTSSANHPDVRNTMFLNMRVKDAIADRFMKNFNKRPDSGGEKRGFSVHVLWKDNQVNLSIDTSGESLSKHGYRLHPFKAPLQESLASGILASSGWDIQIPLILPMCGSGTLAVEAALLAKGIYPGKFRSRWAFMNIKGYSQEMLEKVIESFQRNETADPQVLIYASDQDRMAVDAARKNASEAGVADLIRFEVCDFQSSTIPEGKGIVIINPPYGTRIGEISQLEELYKRIGEFLKKQCTGKTAFILTPEKQLADSIGLRSTARIPFMNADIECRLLKYEIYEGTRKIKKPDA